MPVSPVATYRLQLHAGFDFDAASEIAAYLAELGISHVYCSPYLQAAPGSTHGYDVVDYHRVNDELGGGEGHARFCQTLREHALGQVLDIVPNHMAIAGQHNKWWWDVLENGPASRYASYFDVEWAPPEEKLQNMVLVPILGDHYGRVLEAGEIKIRQEAGALTVHYYDHVLPVAPRSVGSLLSRAAELSDSDELGFIAGSFDDLPLPTATDRESASRRHRDKEVLKKLLARLCEERPEQASAVDEAVAEVNRDVEKLDELLGRQNYRLAFWRTASQQLAYRRFFDINTLAGVRVEDEAVFEDSHRLILNWLRERVLDGVRIDHPDGLREPDRYFQRLRKANPDAWIVAEKILEPEEMLRQTWAIAGSTGYDFLNRVGGLFVDPKSESPLTDFYAEFTGEPTDYPELVREKKHLVMRQALATDIHRLTALLVEVCEGRRRYRDYTREELEDVVSELIACFPVYRSYVHAESGRLGEDDERYINEAVEGAKTHRPEIDPLLFDLLRDVLLLREVGEVEGEFVMRFQQVTPPVTAKGVEDTAFYCFNRLVSLNEVGGNPGLFGLSVQQFHQSCVETHKRWPRTMLNTSTHDTKRGEDARVRISLLSEIPDEWSAAVRRWAHINEKHRSGEQPDRNAEYLLYQTLVGAWPISGERLTSYLQKAAREAKLHTSWTEPNETYEEALESFARKVLAEGEFQADLRRFVEPLLEPAAVTSLSQTLVKLTAPGVPDIYQGCELWNLSLVDPDNRRPVDYSLRRKLLKELDTLSPERIWARRQEGLPKMWLIRQALRLRCELPETLGPEAGYVPVESAGAKASHVVAFARGDQAITVAPRLVWGLAGDWADTTIKIPRGEWQNRMTGDVVAGGDVEMAKLLARFPVALLSREAGGA